jgi:hypothetical protein
MINEMSTLIRPKNEIGDITLPPPYDSIFRIVIRFVVPAILCITSFVRLKEKEF